MNANKNLNGSLMVMLLVSASLGLSGCVTMPSNTSYSSQEVGRISTVQKGTIIAMRLVDVSSTGKDGSAVGGAIGAVGGSSIGSNGRDNLAGAIVGAVVGSAVGAAADKSGSAQKMTEFIVQLEQGDPIAIVQSNEGNLSIGNKVLIIKSGVTRIVLDTTK